MDPAWIAVFGTLSGVVVSTVGGITTSSLTSRNQRLASQRQLESAADDKIRQEVRESFVDYLSAYTALRDRILVFRNECSEASTPATLIEAFAPSESTDFNRAFHTLQITASASVSAAADAAQAQLWDLAKAAEEHDSEAFERELAAGSPLRRALHAAMRTELGVRGDTALPSTQPRSRR
ncbi:hypothetical protein [Nocardia rhizosphaerihabitans]|uniref:Secreted protein n=1 Tax=Nocardia rhizosphaerihabitans TaxID=1691570 RepID=A0ABQ2K301_9NOCA|nr:hypothetical protein [Nocardia rhizosphaerihabitans]GGN66006.1 hypothetical protein GCM10011610_00480 [Nocardia rhizosphaerihabitans]